MLFYYPHPLFKNVVLDCLPALTEPTNACNLKGVYSIESGGVILYIGQTVHFRKRALNHIQGAVNGYHKNKPLADYLLNSHLKNIQIKFTLLDFDNNLEYFFTDAMKPKFSNIDAAIGSPKSFIYE